MNAKRWLFVLTLVAIVAMLAWQVYSRLQVEDAGKRDRKGKDRAVPVEVAPVSTQTMVRLKHFTGTLEAEAEFVASPKVGGVLKSILFKLGDEVMRGQLVASIESEEFDQAVIQSEAELEVARANLQESNSLLKIAERELKRINKLGERGVSSASQRDAAKADQLAKQAQVQVSKAELSRAEALLETAKIRRGYTEVLAEWHGEDETRFVSERYVDEGETVDAQAPLLKIVKLNPLNAVLHVTEKDYADLSLGLSVSLVTDAYPDRQFTGQIVRIAPVFKEASRQARIEVKVANDDLMLKPGMFVRAQVQLETIDNAFTIPRAALIKRNNHFGVFLLSEETKTVSWKKISPGVTYQGRVQIDDPGLTGQVVTLGQQLLKDGSKVFLPNPGASP